MKKINKTPSPNALTDFAEQSPTASWDEFKNENNGKDYDMISQQIFADQGYLCAYCESRVNVTWKNIGKEESTEKPRIEHFHPKSDKSDKNWGLDWNNLVGICIGGEDRGDVHPLPANLSCDAYKNYLFSKKRIDEKTENHFLNPLTDIPATPCLFDFNKRTGELIVNPKIDDNSTLNKAFIKKTIENLNLNCDRLTQQRLVILRDYNREIKKGREKNDKDIFSKLAQKWFQNKWPRFFTTRRILLHRSAEEYLEAINYDG